MARREATVTGPARARVGLPVVADGSRRHPVLVRVDGTRGACNNGCQPCVSEPLDGAGAADGDLAGRHVVVRHREATLARGLPARIAALKAAGAASVALVTNGRMLVYPPVVRALIAAGLDRLVVKLFAVDPAAHDRHARVEGGYAQALAGIAAARAVGGVEVVVAFAGAARDRPAEVALAQALTAREPVVLPEPEVAGHANEYRYDVVNLRDGITFAHPAWNTGVFPMVHINTGPLCNIRCVYCNVRGGTDQRLYDVAYVERLLDDAAARFLAAGASPTIDLIGGEPTMHPELPRLIAAARARGFARVLICTNGVRLARPGYLDQLVAAGLTGVRLSFHDHRAEVAAALADVPGLGATYPEVAAMLLERADLDTHLFRILLTDTIDAVPDYLRWLAAHNRTGRPVDLTLGMPSMRGRLFDNRHLYPALARLRPVVAEAMTLAQGLGFTPTIHHAPACLYPEAPSRAACVHVVTQQLDALTGARTVMNFEGDAGHGAACQACPARAEGCAGLPRAYLDDDRAAAEAWFQPVRFAPGRYPQGG
ncbi:MAG: radical SAM protein [Kofleriaceae bacterium]